LIFYSQAELKIRCEDINFSHFPCLLPSGHFAGRKIALDEKFCTRKRHNTSAISFCTPWKFTRTDNRLVFPLFLSLSFSLSYSHFLYIRISSFILVAILFLISAAFSLGVFRDKKISAAQRQQRNCDTSRSFFFVSFSLPFMYINDAFCSIFPDVQKMLPATFP